MEYTPPITPAEREPSLEPPKLKARRNIFEMFKRHEDEPKPAASEVKNKKSPEKPAEKLPPARERRRFAADIIMLLRGDAERQRQPSKPGESAPEPEPTLDFSEAKLPTAERPPARKPVEAVPVLELAPLPLIERAKEMGRGVLRLIGRVKTDVQAADRSEQIVAPTNVAPLEVADADVRAAMQELIAPIEAYEATHPQLAINPEGGDMPRPAGETPAKDTITAAVESGGGDPEPGLLERAKSPLARTFEVAAAVASVTAREVLQAKELAERQAGRVRKIGLFALGAATVGGFAYTWRRMKKLKKEQRDMRKEHRRFEAEVRANQVHEEQRLHELEQTNVGRLTQPQRQQFVHEVSEFAHAQATEIRTTAHAAEVIQTAAPASVPERSHAPITTRPAQRPETTVFTGRALEKPEKPHGSVFDVPAQTAERPGIIERLGGVVNDAKRSALAGGSGVGGGIAAAGSKLVGALAGTTAAPQAATQNGTAQPQAVPKKYTQAWLLGATLATGLVVVVLFLTGIL